MSYPHRGDAREQGSVPPGGLLHVLDGAVHVDPGEQRGGVVADAVGIVFRAGHGDVERLQVRQALVLDAQFAARDGPVHEEVLVPRREGPAIAADPLVILAIGHEQAAAVDVAVAHGRRRAQGLQGQAQQRFARIGGHRVVPVAVDVLDDFPELVLDHPDRVGPVAPVGFHDRVQHVVGQVAGPRGAAGVQADVLLQFQRADLFAVPPGLFGDFTEIVVDRLVPLELVHGCSFSDRCPPTDRSEGALHVGSAYVGPASTTRRIRAFPRSPRAPVPRRPSGCTGGGRTGSRRRAGRP